MTDVFVLRNQQDEYLSKSLEWLAFGDTKTLFRASHYDEAINQKVELTVKRPDLRIKIVSAEQASNGKIIIGGEECLPRALPQEDQMSEQSLAFNDAPPEQSSENTDKNITLDASEYVSD